MRLLVRRVPDLTKIKKLIGYKLKVKFDQIIVRVRDYFDVLE